MSEFRKYVRLLTLRRILGMAWDLTTYERSQSLMITATEMVGEIRNSKLETRILKSGALNLRAQFL